MLSGPELELLWEKQNHRCHWCSVPLYLGSFKRDLEGQKRDLEGQKQRLATVDHVQDLALNGTNTILNVVWACKQCNSARSNNPK